MNGQHPNRRQDDDTRDIAITTQTMLAEHLRIDDQNSNLLRETIGGIETKLDKLARSQIFVAGVLAALMFLLNFPQFIKIIEPEGARAEGFHVSGH